MKNIIYSAMLALVISFALTAYSDGICSDLESGLIRLHVIANSDSESDQKINLAVRDRILSEIPADTTPDTVARSAREIANKVLSENGFTYGANAQFTKAYFPKKEYKEITLPQGKYRAVRIVL